jgi:hypothetical protein
VEVDLRRLEVGERQHKHLLRVAGYLHK